MTVKGSLQTHMFAFQIANRNRGKKKDERVQKGVNKMELHRDEQRWEMRERKRLRRDLRDSLRQICSKDRLRDMNSATYVIDRRDISWRVFSCRLFHHPIDPLDINALTRVKFSEKIEPFHLKEQISILAGSKNQERAVENAAVLDAITIDY